MFQMGWNHQLVLDFFWIMVVWCFYTEDGFFFKEEFPVFMIYLPRNSLTAKAPEK